MHVDEVEVDATLVRRLLASQFPQWADLQLDPVRSSGTDNAIFRLGSDLSVRLPRIDWAADQPEKEEAWLPRLAPLLPVVVPVPLATGLPGEGYPWRWSISPWLEGRNPPLGAAESDALASDIAGFVREMRALKLADAPEASFGRPLATRDSAVREAIEALAGLVDKDAVTVSWETSLAARPWTAAPVWVHGDLMPGNLIVRQGRLRGVIDFSGTGVGDPACDLIPAWNLLRSAGREVFRAELQVDDATWSRARGFALVKALIALPYYQDTNPGMATIARYTIGEVLAASARED
jgi:aminoglycoside phosphotransferase (APT) family kinase protein